MWRGDLHHKKANQKNSMKTENEKEANVAEGRRSLTSCSDVPSGTKWARANPDLHRERAREAMRRWRKTEKGKAALKANTLRMREKIGAAPKGFWKCLECGAEEEKSSAIAGGWKHVKQYKGLCVYCCKQNT